MVKNIITSFCSYPNQCKINNFRLQWTIKMYYPVALIDKLIEWHNMEKLLTSLFLFSDIYDIIFLYFDSTM